MSAESENPTQRHSLVLAAGRQRGRRSILIREKYLNQTAESFSRSPAVILVGPEGFGKTTLLEQAEEWFQLKAHKIIRVALAKPTGTEDFIKSIASVSAHSLKEWVSVLDQPNTLLVIDNLDLLEDRSALVQLVLNASDLSLLASLSNRASLSAELHLDVEFVDIGGFTAEEIQRLASQLQLKIEAETSDEARSAFDRICEMTRGEPTRVKELFTQALAEGALISKAMLSRNLGDLHRERFKAALGSISDQDKKILVATSFFERPLKKVDGFLNRISSFALNESLSLGIVLRAESGLELEKAFKEYLVTQVRKEHLDFLLAELSENLEGLKDLDLLLESIRLLKAAGQSERAAKIFNENAEGVLKKANSESLVKASDGLISLLDRAGMELRIESLISNNEFRKNLDEVQTLLKETKDERIHRYLRIQEARAIGVNGDHEEALSRYEKVILEFAEDVEIQIEARIRISYRLGTSHLNLYGQHLEWIEKIGMVARPDLKSRWEGDLFSLKAINATKAGRFDQAADFHLRASKAHLDRGDRASSQVDYMFHITALVDAGEFLLAKDRIAALREQHIGDQIALVDVERLAVEFRFEFLSGGLSGFLNSLSSAFDSTFYKPSAPRGFFQNIYCSVLIRLGMQSESKEFCRRALTTRGRFKSDRHFLLTEAINTFLELDGNLEPELLQYQLSVLINNIPNTDHRVWFACLAQEVLLSRRAISFLKSGDPFDFDPQMPSVDAAFIIDFLAARGTFLVLSGRAGVGSKMLKDCLRRIEGQELHFVERRALMALVWVDLKDKDYAKAREKLDQILALTEIIDPTWEKSVAHVMSPLLRFLEGRVKTAYKDLSESPENEDARALLRILFDERVQVSANILSYWQRVLQIVGVSETRERLQKASVTSDKDFILDEGSKELRHRKGKTLRLSRHPVAWACIKLMLSRLGYEFRKDELVSLLWHEDYNPLVHDNRIYNLISSLRKLLSEIGAEAYLIESEGCYGFSRAMKVLAQEPEQKKDVTDRQEWILQYLRKHPQITREEVQRHLRVSAAVAKRELKELVDRAALELSGQGKASFYRLK